MNRSQRIAAQLGMSQGAANNRLRKNIMYKYVRLADDHFCFRCGAEIESVDDFTIEHKVPWERRDAELFWSLDNIAFSHAQCNRNHVSKNQYSDRRASIPDTMKWCPGCNQPVSLESFARNRGSHDGYRNYCRGCDR